MRGVREVDVPGGEEGGAWSVSTGGLGGRGGRMSVRAIASKGRREMASGSPLLLLPSGIR